MRYECDTDILTSKIMSVAMERAREVLGISTQRNARWVSAERLTTKNSQLLRAELLVDGEARLSAMFKRYRAVESSTVLDTSQATRTAKEIRTSISRGVDLTPILNERLAGVSMHVPDYLAADPESLTEVRLVAAGRHPAKVYRAAASRRRWRTEMAMYRAMGEFIAQLESVAPATGSVDLPLNRVDLLAGRLRSAGLPPSLSTDFRAAIDESYTRALPFGRVHNHGDYGRGNVLVGDGSLSVVDVGWPVRLRGQDIALCALRLELERPRLGRLTQRSIGEMLTGYSRECGIDSSVFRFVRLWCFAILVAEPALTGRGSMLRAPALRRLLIKEMYV